MKRREFLKTFAGMAALTVVPRHVLGGVGYTAPSDQLTKGIIGVGGMGRGHYGYAGTRLVAICDVDKNHLEAGRQLAGEKVATYSDYRQLIADPNVDIVHIATPPHWHGIMSVEAAAAGKDIWCEKPMTRTIGEGKRVKEAVERNGNIFRLNTWFRFTDTFYGMNTTVDKIKKLVDSGMLGWPLKVTISKHTGFDWKFFWVGQPQLEEMKVPAELDYDMWLGPAPYKPYNPHRVHGTFRGYWDYDAGGLGDMGQHYIDPVQYLLGKDDTSPVSVEIDAPQQHPDAVGTWRKIEYTYDDGCKIVLLGRGQRRSERRLYRRTEREALPQFPVRHTRLGSQAGRISRSDAPADRFSGLCAYAPEVCAERAERIPLGDDRQHGRRGSPVGTVVAVRSREAAVYRRRCGQPADRPADARALDHLTQP